MRILGVTGNCRLWIPRFAEIAQLIYSAMVGDQSLKWTETEEQVFLELNQTLTQGLALALPSVTKLFHLYIHKTQGIAKDSLTQTLEPWWRSIV